MGRPNTVLSQNSSEWKLATQKPVRFKYIETISQKGLDLDLSHIARLYEQRNLLDNLKLTSTIFVNPPFLRKRNNIFKFFLTHYEIRSCLRGKNSIQDKNDTHACAIFSMSSVYL